MQSLVSKDFAGARDLAAVLKIVRIVYESALVGKSVTQRELYYMAASFFSSQDECKTALARASALLELERHELGVVASSRGRCAGLLRVRNRADTSTADLAASGDAMPIPGDCIAAPPGIENAGARWILVVEKDAIFSRLVEDRIWEAVPCVLVTGCGMPDLATRAFVHQLHTELGLPALGLCDCNPYGLGIMLCYIAGSKADGRRHGVPVAWLGLRRRDVARYGLPLAAAQAMSPADERKAATLLDNAYVAAQATPAAAAFRRECLGFMGTDDDEGEEEEEEEGEGDAIDSEGEDGSGHLRAADEGGDKGGHGGDSGATKAGAGSLSAAPAAVRGGAPLPPLCKMELEGLLGKGVMFLSRVFLPDKVRRCDWEEA